MRRMRSDCCARAAERPRSRRADGKRDEFASLHMPRKDHALYKHFATPMPALGQKRTFALQNVMSALPPKADMCGATAHVRFVPIADIDATSTLDTHSECHTGEALAMSFGQTVTSSLLRH